ncbi:MAG: LPP20 family lipoprotein [Endomicrobiales bacterium]|nr:LPP20 family lipoprotein [Endomicrobiales bacterium]
MKQFYKVGLAVFISLLVGCAGMQKKPDWVIKGSGAFKKEKKVLYGVGIAEGIKSEALRRTTADNRAIAEISRQLSTMSTSLMRDYMSSAMATEEEKTSGEQYVENTIKTFTSNTVSGVKIIDRWDDGKVYYSLAALDIEQLKAMTDNINKLSQQVKEYIKENAEKAFDKLEEEQQKRGQ